MAGEPQGSERPSVPPKVQIPKLEASLAAWLILFVLGGGLLALYYAGIGYFPEFTWQDALSYMALMTIIGGGLLVAYSFLLFVPGVIWSEYLISDEQLFQVLKMGGPGRDWEPCVLSVAKRIVFPFALFMTSCHCLLYLLDKDREPAGLVAVGAATSLVTVSSLLGRDFLEVLLQAADSKSRVIPDRPRLWWHRLLVGLSHGPLLILFVVKSFWPDNFWTNPYCLWSAALFPLTGFWGLLIDRRSVPARSNPDESGMDPIPDRWSLICRAILAFVSAALLGLAALWFFYRIYSSGEASGAAGKAEVTPEGLLVLCTLVVIVANLIVSVLYRKHPHSALLASFLGALVLLGAGQFLPSREAKLPDRIMEKFGFGVPNVTLVVTEKGGRILCQYGISVNTAGSSPAENFCARPEMPEGLDKKGDKPEVRARAEGFKILSRLGSEYLVGFEKEKEKGKKEERQIITLPKSEIVSWSASDSPNPQPAMQAKGRLGFLPFKVP